MGGLAVIFLLGLYFVLVVIALIKTKPVWAKGLVLLAALLIPVVDAVYGRIKLKHMCEAEAGLRVYREAHNVRGFMASAADGFYINRYGYEFVEAERSPGRYYRVSRQNKSIVVEENVTPKSQYRLKTIRDFEMKNYKNENIYYKYQDVIEDVATGEILSTYTHLAFKGGWAERFLGKLSDAGAGNVAWCSSEPFLNKPYIDTMQLLITRTLKHEMRH